MPSLHFLQARVATAIIKGSQQWGVAMVASSMRNLTAPLLLCLVLLPGAAPAGEAGTGPVDPLSEDLVPTPALSPEDVVRIQLEALRHNDRRNRGIAVAFRFASPANRAHTGPLWRFIRMIRNGPYALMLNYHAAGYGPVEASGGQARQRVVLAGSTTSVTFWFHLSRQPEAPYADCWMTDAVFIEPVEGHAA